MAMMIKEVKKVKLPHISGSHEIKILLNRVADGSYVIIYKKYKKDILLDYDSYNCVSVEEKKAIKEFDLKVSILKQEGYGKKKETKSSN